MDAFVVYADPEYHTTKAQEKAAFERLWQPALKHQLTLPAGSQFKAAMMPYNIERDTASAYASIKASALALLLKDSPPSLADILSLPWVDTRNPGVYGCIGRKWNATGELIDMALKVGCAWSETGGMRQRRNVHENDVQSAEE